MILPRLTMIIDVGPKIIVVTSADSICSLVEKLKSMSINESLRQNITSAITRYTPGFRIGQTHSLLGGRVQVSAS